MSTSVHHQVVVEDLWELCLEFFPNVLQAFFPKKTNECYVGEDDLKEAHAGECLACMLSGGCHP
jgi:hypothetical protein